MTYNAMPQQPNIFFPEPPVTMGIDTLVDSLIRGGANAKEWAGRLPAPFDVAPLPLSSEAECVTCGETLPLEAFARRAEKRNGRRSSCLTCEASARRRGRLERVWKRGSIVRQKT